MLGLFCGNQDFTVLYYSIAGGFFFWLGLLWKLVVMVKFHFYATLMFPYKEIVTFSWKGNIEIAGQMQ